MIHPRSWIKKEHNKINDTQISCFISNNSDGHNQKLLKYFCPQYPQNNKLSWNKLKQEVKDKQNENEILPKDIKSLKYVKTTDVFRCLCFEIVKQ